MLTVGPPMAPLARRKGRTTKRQQNQALLSFRGALSGISASQPISQGGASVDPRFSIPYIMLQGSPVRKLTEPS